MSENDAPGWSSRMPRGPWLAVLGMHRSGTSAITGTLGALGFATPRPDDRMDWPQSNPEHWESSSMAIYDESLLTRLGGSWEAPPDLSPDWVDGTDLRQAPDPVAAARLAYPDSGPLVWKDPRLCLLLPYWRRILPPPLAAVMVWRSPLSVARSLQKRDGMHLADGVALWERYNRCALENLVGLDTYVCSYETVLDDPSTALAAMADWLVALPQFAPYAHRWSPETAAAMVTAGSDHPMEIDRGLLLAQHQELVTRLSELEGGHLPLGPTPLASESGWTTAILADRRGSRTRELDKLEARRKNLESQLKDTQLAVDRMRGSTSWRMTKPIRSVISLIRG